MKPSSFVLTRGVTADRTQVKTHSVAKTTSCSEISTVYGIPPWGFHTGSYTGESSFAKGHGNIDLQANTVSGVMCRQDRAGVIVMLVEHHLGYHSHYAMMWGYPAKGRT